MFAMFKQLFVAITVYFTALERSAKAVDHLAQWAEETSAAFADEARIERQKKLAILKADLKAVESKQPKAA